MYKSRSVFRSVFFNSMAMLLCLISSVIAFLGDNESYKTLGILPIAYMLIYLFSMAIFKERVLGNIGYILFWGQSIIKCVISPMILCLGNYTSIFRELTSEYIFGAVLLMIYEQLACVITIALVSPNTKRIKVVLPWNGQLHKLTFRTFIMFFGFIILVIWVLVPTVKNNLVPIFDMFSSRQMFLGYDYISANTSGAFDRILTTLFLVLFKSFRIIFPFYIIKVLKQKYDSAGSFAFSIIIVAMEFLFISETVAMALVVAFLLLSYMLDIYPKYRRAVIAIMIFSSVFVVFVLSLNYENISTWYGVDNIIEYASQILQSYVPGVCNTASIFRLERVSRILSLWDTLISTIPFQNTIFGSVSWNHDINAVFTSVSGLGGQICSTIGGGWYIFGALGAPLFSVLFTYVSIANGYKYMETDEELKKLMYLYMCIQSILGIGVYNIQTTITLWIQVGFVMYIGTKFANSPKKG